MTVLVFSLKCSGTQESSEPTEGKKQVMFELKAAIVYHAWRYSPVQTGQLLHTESNNEKNFTLSPPAPKSRGPMPTSAGSQELLKQGLKCPNNNYAVRGV